MATPEQVGDNPDAQDATTQLPLSEEKRDDVEDVQLSPPPPAAPSQGEQQQQEQQTSEDTAATIDASTAIPEEIEQEEEETENEQTPGDDDAPLPESSAAVAVPAPSDHTLQIETEISTTNEVEGEKTDDTEKAESSENADAVRTIEEVASASSESLPQQNEDAISTGDSTPVLQDGASTPSTPRSTPAKPSVFKKAASIQKVTVSKDFLKSILPAAQSPSPGVSATPRPAVAEKPKPTSSASKALKPMVRNRLSNMGASMQRQGSGSSTPKSGRGMSPNFGRGAQGNEVWSWRRQPAAQKEWSEEELQKQGVHLTARLTNTGDDGNKWADMDDDWSDEEVMEDTREIRPPTPFHEESIAPHENHVQDESIHIAPHILESAALAQVPGKQEDHHQHIFVSKNDRFADVTYDRRDNRSPDQNIHGQRQIYNPKLGRFEAVEPAKEPERHGRRNIEIMQRGPGRRGSSAGRRRESLTKGMVMDEPRQSRAPHVENWQRRTSFAEQRDSPLHPHRRRDSFISTSGVSDADRSVSNASPGLDSVTTPDLPPVDLLALQQKEMAESRKRAMERRAKDEEERLAAAERAKKKAAELAAQAGSASASPSEAGKSDASPVSPAPSSATPAATKASPISAKASPVPPKAYPLPPKATPATAPAATLAKPSPVPPITRLPITIDEPTPPTRTKRSDSGVWQANRDQEISKEDSVTSQDGHGPKWGAIGPSQKPTTTHKPNGLFTNPNTLATLNSTIGGDMGRRGRNAPRAPRGPINPANVPPPLQGWAAFAGNIETRRAHDNEKQLERAQEQERLDREREANGPRTQSIVDKWKKVEIKEPENAGDIAGRTVVSVLKSGYVEDGSGNVEVKDVASSGIPAVLPPGAATPLTSAKSPTISSAQALGMQTPTQPPLGDKTPGSRDRSRFFPSPASTVVDMSPRIVHPIQPQQSDKSLFPQSLFPSFDDISKTPSSSSAVPSITPLPSTSTSFAAPTQNHQAQPQSHLPAFAQYGPPLPTSPGQSLAAAPHIVGMTPRSSFSHTMPVTSPPLQPQYKAKLPSVEDFDTVLARLRETMQTTQEPANEDMTMYADPTAVDPQIQTRSDSTPASSDTASFLRISAISQHRDLEISSRDAVDEEPVPRTPTVRVSLPKMLHTTTRDIEIPIETKRTHAPTINIPSEPPSISPSASDLKSRLHAVDQALNSFQKVPFLLRSHHTPSHTHPQAFKIQFSEWLRPRGDVVPNLVKKDKRGFPYVNFEAKPEALNLPGYAHDNEVFYTSRDFPHEGVRSAHNKHPKFHGKFKERAGPQTPPHYRRGARGERGGSVTGEASSSSTASSTRGGGTPSRVPAEKK